MLTQVRLLVVYLVHRILYLDCVSLTFIVLLKLLVESRIDNWLVIDVRVRHTLFILHFYGPHIELSLPFGRVILIVNIKIDFLLVFGQVIIDIKLSRGRSCHLYAWTRVLVLFRNLSNLCNSTLRLRLTRLGRINICSIQIFQLSSYPIGLLLVILSLIVTLLYTLVLSLLTLMKTEVRNLIIYLWSVRIQLRTFLIFVFNDDFRACLTVFVNVHFAHFV